jgi:hypothetical protein
MIRLSQIDEWLICAAFLAALLVLTSIGLTASIAWHNQSFWQVATSTPSYSRADDYVEGLARLGIAKLPSHPLLELSDPVVAAH